MAAKQSLHKRRPQRRVQSRNHARRDTLRFSDGPCIKFDKGSATPLSHEQRVALINAPLPTFNVYSSRFKGAGVQISEGVPRTGRRVPPHDPDDNDEEWR